MYLFFDTNGILKEQITVSPPVVGNSGVDKIYVYWDGVESRNITGCWGKYRLADTNEYTDYLYYDEISNSQIPYDQDRDLKFFHYNQTYKFYVFNIPDIVLSPTGDLDVYSVAFSCWFEIDGTEEDTPVMEDDKLKAMSLVAFAVNPSTASVAQDNNINIAQWNQLVKMINNIADFDVNDVVTLSTNQDIEGNKNFTGDVTRNGYDLLDTSALKPTILTPVVCGPFSSIGGDTVEVPLPDGTGGVTVNVYSGYQIVASATNAIVTYIDQATGDISLSGEIGATAILSWHYESTRIGFRFTIGTDYNGLYVFTHSYLTMLIPVYALTEGQTYKFVGVGLQDGTTGSVMTMVHNMQRNGQYLDIWSGNSDYPMIAGRVGTLAKVKLYS